MSNLEKVLRSVGSKLTLSLVSLCKPLHTPGRKQRRGTMTFIVVAVAPLL
uniref:Uncharacterized protein n=1 Tax=Anguilla anguilla TaxID=7936 RepID=A0A0E9QS01_ANGAN